MMIVDRHKFRNALLNVGAQCRVESINHSLVEPVALEIISKLSTERKGDNVGSEMLPKASLVSDGLTNYQGE